MLLYNVDDNFIKKSLDNCVGVNDKISGLNVTSRFQSFDLFKGMIKMLFKIWIINLVAKILFCEGIFLIYKHNIFQIVPWQLNKFASTNDCLLS